MVDSHKGYIRAMASSQSFSTDSQFNLATQALRQPGSTFKTFVLTQAIRHGINPYTTLYGSKPLELHDPHYGLIDVQTYSHTYRGAIPIASALLSSDNSVFQQLTLDVGPENVIETAYDMGIPKERNLPDVASIGLGSGEVTPLDMADAYAPLSNGGYRVAPLAISKIVKPNGDVDNFAPERDRAFSDGVAYEVARILQNNIHGRHGRRGQHRRAGRRQDRHDQRLSWTPGSSATRRSTRPPCGSGYPNSDGVKRYDDQRPRHRRGRRHLPRRRSGTTS